MTDSNRRYFEASSAIGRLLVRDAVWAGNRCSWLTQTLQPSSTGSQFVVRACSLGFSEGACGIGVFLARLNRFAADPMIAEVVAGVHQLLTQLGPSQPSEIDSTDFQLECALIEMMASAGERRSTPFVLPDCPQLLDAGTEATPDTLAEKFIRGALSSQEQYPCFVDPLLADSFLNQWRSTCDARWLEAARTIADFVIAKSEQHGQPWRGGIGVEYPPLGLKNGLAGVGHFLLRVGRPDDTPPLTFHQ